MLSQDMTLTRRPWSCYDKTCFDGWGCLSLTLQQGRDVLGTELLTDAAT